MTGGNSKTMGCCWAHSLAHRDFFRSRHIEIYYSFTVYRIPPRLEIRNLPLILWPPKRKKLRRDKEFGYHYQQGERVKKNQSNQYSYSFFSACKDKFTLPKQMGRKKVTLKSHSWAIRNPSNSKPSHALDLYLFLFH